MSAPSKTRKSIVRPSSQSCFGEGLQISTKLKSEKKHMQIHKAYTNVNPHKSCFGFRKVRKCILMTPLVQKLPPSIPEKFIHSARAPPPALRHSCGSTVHPNSSQPTRPIETTWKLQVSWGTIEKIDNQSETLPILGDGFHGHVNI